MERHTFSEHCDKCGKQTAFTSVEAPVAGTSARSKGRCKPCTEFEKANKTWQSGGDTGDVFRGGSGCVLALFIIGWNFITNGGI